MSFVKLLPSSGTLHRLQFQPAQNLPPTLTDSLTGHPTWDVLTKESSDISQIQNTNLKLSKLARGSLLTTVWSAVKR